MEDEDLNFDLTSTLKNYLSCSENKFELNALLNMIKRNQGNRLYVIRFLQQLKENVSLLSPDVFEQNIVNVVLVEIKWPLYYSRDSQVLGLLVDFLIDLNNAYTYYIYKCLLLTVKSLFSVANDSTNPDLIDCQSIYKIAHSLIYHLFKIADSCQSQMVKLVEQNFPYMIKESHVQRAYISNVLKIATKYPNIRLALLEICVQRLLKIDVNLSREIVQNDDMEEDDDMKSQENHELPSPVRELSMKNPLADRLDVMMQCILEFVQNFIRDSTGNLDWENCRALYKDFLFTFDKYVLSTYGSNHVQFIMFYICAQRSNLAEGFLDYLWKKFTSINSNAIIKQACAYYMGSYLARAKYVSIEMCTAILQLMISWAHSYADKQAIIQTNFSDHGSNFSLHRTYYSLCQTIFYTIIFRSRQLFDERYADLVRTWKLNDMVSCKLNPLKYCLSTVRDKFAKIAYVNRVAYCYSIIDANKRVSIPHRLESSRGIIYGDSAKSLAKSTSSPALSSSSLSTANPLDSFFPFDPYFLKRSKKFINDFYIQFSQVEDIDSDDEIGHEDDEDEEQLEDGENQSEEYDDIIQENIKEESLFY